MVKYQNYNKIQLKTALFFVVILGVIINLALGNVVYAKKFEITDKDVKRIKTALDWAKTFSNIAITDNELKTILNTVIGTGESGVDVSYGLISLIAFNEMEFIDMVVSHEYIAKSDAYFNEVLDERLNLGKHYQGLSFDILRAIFGNITNPLSAHTLNTFEITNKVIQIGVEIQNLKLMQLYDGLWVYFDDRKSNEPHEVSWEEAKTRMGWWATSTSFRRSKSRNEDNFQTESQFAVLYEKWGPYVTINVGVNKDYKQQVRKEFGDSIVYAIKIHESEFAQEQQEPKPSFTEKVKNDFRNLVNALGGLINLAKEKGENLVSDLKYLLSRIGSGTIGKVQTPELQKEVEKELEKVKEEIKTLEEEDVEEDVEVKPQQSQSQLARDEIEKRIGEISKRIEVIASQSAELREKEKIIKSEEKIEEEVLEEEVEEKKIEVKIQKDEAALCQKIAGSMPSRNKIIFNEIAWMGTANSANDEWFELKNISGKELDLTGWQILDKENQIKIVFATSTINVGRVSAKVFLLLERTNDESVPGVAADFIYTGALSNTNEALYLFDGSCQLQDEVLAEPNWPTGDNSSKRTMERRADLFWQTSAHPGGTPKMGNSSGYVEVLSSSGGGGGGSGGGGGGSGGGEIVQPQISLSFPQNNPVDKEIEVALSASNLKNAVYDVKISIEKGTTTLSEIFNEKINDWQSSRYYVTSTFSGVSFLGNFKLRIKEDKEYFLGEADIIAKIRESGTIYTQFSGKINITNPEILNQPPNASFIFSPQNPLPDQEIIFNAASSTDADGTILSYIWDFGDNNSTTTNQAATTHSYSTSGVDYVVMLWVVDNLGATSTSATTTIVFAVPETPTLSVVINEIAWMGTKANSADEWIEIYNNTTSTIDITGWQLISSDGGPDIIFSTSTAATTTILAQGFYLIERTDDNTVSDILADWKGSFGSGLSNSNCEVLSLYDKNNNLVDKTVCLEDGNWPAGKGNPDYISMERISATITGATSTNWASNNLITRNGKDVGQNNINGTPRAKNSVSTSPTTISSLPFDEGFDEITLTFRNSPYLISGNLTVSQNKNLLIESGVIIKFCQDCELNIEGKMETLNINSENVVFTSWRDDEYGGDTNQDGVSTGQVGDWNRIYFKNSFDSKLKNIIARYGGKLFSLVPPYTDDSYLPVFHIESGGITIENATITDSSTIGIRLDNSSSTIKNVFFSNIAKLLPTTRKTAAIFVTEGGSTIQDCIFENNSIGIEIKNGSPTVLNSTFKNNLTDDLTGTGILINNGTPRIENNIFDNNDIPVHLSALSSPIFLANASATQNNKLNGILVKDQVVATTTWQADLPYVINQNFTISQNGTLILQPGVIVKFKKQSEDKKPSLLIYGKILAQTTSTQPIIFTSFNDDYGNDTNGTTTQPQSSDWLSLRFFSSSSILDGARIRYGGSTYEITIGTLSIEEDVQITIQNSIIENNRCAITYAPFNCAIINQKINQLKTEDNVIFQNNDFDTYPQCGR